MWLAGPWCSCTLGQRLLLTLTSRYRSPLGGMDLFENSWVIGSQHFVQLRPKLQTNSLSTLRIFGAKNNLKQVR